MKKQLLLVLTAAGLAVSVWADDFWGKMPFKEWSDKQVGKILNNSPWAKEVAAAFNMEGGGSADGSRGGGRRGGRGGGGGMGSGGGMSAASGGMGSGGGMGGAAGGMEGGSGMGGAPSAGTGGGPPAVTALVRWQSALPVKQALVRSKYGAEAESSAEANQILSHQESHYVLVLDKLSPNLSRMDPARILERMKPLTALNRKGKEPILPDDIRIGSTAKSVMIYFLFPKRAPITLEDKEVEFATKLGPLEFKKKFKLQDMVLAGKLEL